MKRKSFISGIIILSMMAVFLGACTEPGNTSPTPTAPPVTQPTQLGTVQMWVTDAPRTDNVTEIWVTVSDVKIHEAVATQTSQEGPGETEGEVDDSTDTGGWLPVSLTGETRFDLLTLRGDGEGGGLQQILGAANLLEEKYTQIRMTVEKVEVKIDGVLKDATLPSGKLKFVHPFDVKADNVTKLLFDFDADKFVTVTGSPNEPKIMVKPVVKLIVSKPKPAAEPGVEITTPSLPDGTLGTAYNATLAATGGTSPYTWSLSSGSLPGGLTLSAEGVISGAPAAGTAGDYTFTVKVSDSSTPVKDDTEEYQITIAEIEALIITTTGLADGKETVAYTATLAALGGTSPYTWSITSGNLPDGLTLDSATGVISGTPTENGEFGFTVQVSDSVTPTANTDTQQLSINIAQS